MNVTGKVWGTTSLVLKTGLIEVHYLVIKPKHCCSLHCHNYKWNAFMVQSGVLDIWIDKIDYDLTDRTTLGPGEFTTVKPGEFHRFSSRNKEVRAWEIYYPQELTEDIIRNDCGSMLD